MVGRLLVSCLWGVAPCPRITHQCLVAANHNSHVDVIVLFRLFDIARVNQVKTIAARDYFSRGLGGFMAQFFFNAVLVDRGVSAHKTVQAIKAELDHGHSLIIFPEGTRGRPGVMAGFKAGIGQVALDFPDLPIYPVYLAGPEKSLPKGSWIPVPFNICMTVAPPVYGRDYRHLDQKDGRKAVAAEIERQIREMEKQESAPPIRI